MTFDYWTHRWDGRYGPFIDEDASLRTYRLVLRRHLLPELGAIDVACLTTARIVDFLGLKLQDASVNYVRQMLSVLRMVLDVAVEEGAIAVNPASRLPRLVKRRLRRIDEPEQMALERGDGRRLADAARRIHPEVALVIDTYRTTGVRRCEALGLREEDCDFAQHRLWIRGQWKGRRRGWVKTKGRRVRCVPMSGGLADTLRAAIDASRRRSDDGTGWVFRGPNGTPWCANVVNRVLRDAGRVLGVRRYSPKAFRHAVASLLANGGENPKAIQEQFGHANITTTQLYARHGVARRLLSADATEEV